MAPVVGLTLGAKALPSLAIVHPVSFPRLMAKMVPSMRVRFACMFIADLRILL